MAFVFCTLGSGSRGNCVLVRAGRTSVLIDAGFSAREIGRRLAQRGLAPADIDAVLLTHEHADHVAGAAVASRRWKRPVLCRPAVAARTRLAERGANVQELEMGPVDVGDLRITPFPVPHDAVETVGFLLEGEGMRAAYATDLGRSTPDVERHLAGCHVVALEANHDVEMTRGGPYPWTLKQRILGERGHLSNQEAGQILARIVGPETTHVVLTHLSETNNAPHLALVEARTGIDGSRNPHAVVRAAAQGAPDRPITL